jgi:CBS domain-containing protein
VAALAGGGKKVGEMVVRIHMEDQYRLSDAAVAEMDKLDDALNAAMDAGDTAAFSAALNAMLAYVRQNGAKVPLDEIIPSDVILPSEDMTLEDAREIMEKPIATPASADSTPTPD